jgi:hypothetical protein
MTEAGAISVRSNRVAATVGHRPVTRSAPSMALGTPRSAASMNDVSRRDSALSVLSLRFEVLDDRPDWPVVSILVDSENPFRSEAADWRGFDPREILGTDSPLIPTDSGRRVAVTTCSCGIAGCGVIAPMIVASPDGRRISWVDFRDFTGVFDRPIADTRDLEGRPWGFPDLHFDRQQYLAEVERATADRTWETSTRVTARLLTGLLRDREPALVPDFKLSWVSPHWDGDGVQLSFLRIRRSRVWQNGDQVLLRLRSERGDPAEASAEMLARFLAVAADERAATFRDASWDRTC